MTGIAKWLLAAFCAVAITPSILGKDAVQWQRAKVIYVRYAGDGGPAGLSQAAAGARSGGGGPPVVRGELDFEGRDFVYTAVEWVAANTRLALTDGDAVEIAIDKKRLLLKLPNGKTRKFKLLSTHKKGSYGRPAPTPQAH